MIAKVIPIEKCARTRAQADIQFKLKNQQMKHTKRVLALDKSLALIPLPLRSFCTLKWCVYFGPTTWGITPSPESLQSIFSNSRESSLKVFVSLVRGTNRRPRVSPLLPDRTRAIDEGGMLVSIEREQLGRTCETDSEAFSFRN